MTDFTRKLATMVLSAVLMLASPFALAASGELPWTAYLAVGLSISIVSAYVLAMRHKNVEGMGLKFIIGCMYFWVVTFVQLTLFGAVYHFSD